MLPTVCSVCLVRGEALFMIIPFSYLEIWEFTPETRESIRPNTTRDPVPKQKEPFCFLITSYHQYVCIINYLVTLIPTCCTLLCTICNILRLTSFLQLTIINTKYLRQPLVISRLSVSTLERKIIITEREQGFTCIYHVIFLFQFVDLTTST